MKNGIIQATACALSLAPLNPAYRFPKLYWIETRKVAKHIIAFCLMINSNGNPKIFWKSYSSLTFELVPGFNAKNTYKPYIIMQLSVAPI